MSYDLGQFHLGLVDSYGGRQPVPGAVALVGDSRHWIPTWDRLSGRRVISCALPGATIGIVANLGGACVLNSQAGVAVIQVGVNNAWIPLADSQWQTYEADYGRILDTLALQVPKLIVTTPYPPEDGKGLGDLSWRVWQIRDFFVPAIKRQSAARGVPVIDLFAEFALWNGIAKPGTTKDGIHPSDATLARCHDLYEAAILSACGPAAQAPAA